MGNLTVKESGEMVNFISPNVSNITSFKVHFSPRQEGSGDPSPDNVREITGWNGVEGYISNVAQPYSSTSNTLTAAIDWTEDVGTVYGGYVDLISGELVQEYASITLTGAEEGWQFYGTEIEGGHIFSNSQLTNHIGGTQRPTEEFCTHFPMSRNWKKILNTCIVGESGLIGFTVDNSIAETVEEFTQFLAEQYANGTPVRLVYKIYVSYYANYTIYQLTPQQLSTLKGQNNFWSNADYVEIEYELTETFDIQKAKRKIILNQPHVESASGDLVTFDTDMKGKLKECKVYFSPVQEGEGDPSPDNVRNITGWSGVEVIQTNQNLIRADDPNNPTLNYHARSSYNYIVYSEEEQAFTERNTIEHVGGGINEANHARINTTKNDQARLFIAPKDGIYTFTCDYKNVGTNYGLRFYKVIDGVSTRLGDIHGDADELWHTRSFTVELNKGDSFRVYLYSNIYWRNFRVIEGDGTDYIENVTNDYSISWADSAGTVYGGYVDLVSGELVQTWYEFILDGVNNFLEAGPQLLNNGLVTIYNYIGSGGLNNLPKGPVNAYTGAIICNKFPLAYSRENEGIVVGSGSLYIRLILDPSKLEDVSSTSAIRESMIKWQQENPLQIVYKLKDPIHYQLTPQQIATLKGTNNIYSNTNGQTKIKYWKH